MSQLVMLWFLHASAAAVALLSVLAATSMASVAHATGRPAGCPSMCGDVDIPYPFGLREDCAWPGFTVACNDSFSPPRPYYFNIEIKDISLEAGEMRVYSPVMYNCYNSSNTTSGSDENIILQLNLTDTPFLVSPYRNEFTATGCDTLALLLGRDDMSFFTGCITTCASLDDAAHDGDQCTGLGCCQVKPIPRNLSTIAMQLLRNITDRSIAAQSYSPCRYAFVAETYWYNFSRQDFTPAGSKSFANRTGEKYVPTVLDWAIRGNGSCSSTAPACVSEHSFCANATNGDGYLCKCTKGYDGNPYLTGDRGCTNINECDPSIYKENYPCPGGTCFDHDGHYECKCSFGRRKDRENGHECQPVLSKSAIVVITIVCAIAILSILLIFLRMELEKRKLRDSFNKNGGQLLKNIGIKIFTKEEMGKITNNYSTILGKGGFGEVYMGTTDNNQQVAVKRSITVDEVRQKDFANEITIQSQINHKNAVRLVGCCLETNIPMLVFEYIPKGSLHDVLHGKGNISNNVARHTLSLQVRLAIAMESADALAYMHSSASQKILHGDVKSSNILLDDNFMPKVSDFGISRLISIDKHHTNFVAGDKNYIDPVYMKTGILTEKSDVYSFGVVLLELITRKKARYDGNNSLSINFVKSYMTDSRAREMFDDEIMSTEVIHCLDMIGSIAVQSLKEDVDERPTMKQVLEHLHLVMKGMDANTRAYELSSNS